MASMEMKHVPSRSLFRNFASRQRSLSVFAGSSEEEDGEHAVRVTTTWGMPWFTCPLPGPAQSHGAS